MCVFYLFIDSILSTIDLLDDIQCSVQDILILVVTNCEIGFYLAIFAYWYFTIFVTCITVINWRPTEPVLSVYQYYTSTLYKLSVISFHTLHFLLDNVPTYCLLTAGCSGGNGVSNCGVINVSGSCFVLSCSYAL